MHWHCELLTHLYWVTHAFVLWVTHASVLWVTYTFVLSYSCILIVIYLYICTELLIHLYCELVYICTELLTSSCWLWVTYSFASWQSAESLSWSIWSVYWLCLIQGHLYLQLQYYLYTILYASDSIIFLYFFGRRHAVYECILYLLISMIYNC